MLFRSVSQSRYIPAGGVLTFAILVFVLSFKKVAEPTFSTSLVGDKKKKQQLKQKPKTKKAPVANGTVDSTVKEVKKAAPVAQTKSPAKTAVTKKESPKKTVKAEAPSKLAKKNAEAQAKLLAEPKPDDYDEGEWVQAVSKKKKKTPDASSISANASPVTSPTHQADKKADKKKKEAKKQEEQAANEKTAETVEAAPHALAEASQVQAEPPKIEAEVVAERRSKSRHLRRRRLRRSQWNSPKRRTTTLKPLNRRKLKSRPLRK